MTDAERIERLEEDKLLLFGLLRQAMDAMADPAPKRPPGDPRVWRYAGERPVQRLLRVIDGGAA